MTATEGQDAVQEATQESPAGGRSRLVWALWLWSAVALLFMLLALFATFFDRFPSDERITGAFQGVDVPAFGGFLDFVNLVGDVWFYVPLTIALSVAFIAARSPLAAGMVLLTFGARGASSLVKGWVERPRPSPELVDVAHNESGFSFPSGHTVGTAALFGVLFFLIPLVVPWRPVRWLLQGGCLLMVLAAGPARVYVGVHWPSDVFGGYLLALLYLAPLLAAYGAARWWRAPHSES